MESIVLSKQKYKCFALFRQRTLYSRHFSGRFKNIKLKFYPKKVAPKITKSTLQPCDAGIIKTLNINVESC